MKKFIPHILVLAILAIAEIPRLQVFFDIIVNNPITSYMVAFVSIAIIFYLSYYKHNVLSIIATVVCIAINIASFQPVMQEKQEALTGEKLPLLEYPTFEQSKYWSGRDTYKKAYELEVSRVEQINKEREERNETSQSPVHFWYLLATALVMSIFIPVLNFVVSHKIADLAYGSATLTKRDGNDDDDYSDGGFPNFPVSVNGYHPENEDDTIKPIAVNNFDNSEKVTRNQEIINLYKSGMSMAEIGRRFNVSRQRVHNIVKSILTPNGDLLFG